MLCEFSYLLSMLMIMIFYVITVFVKVLLVAYHAYYVEQVTTSSGNNSPIAYLLPAAMTWK